MVNAPGDSDERQAGELEEFACSALTLLHRLARRLPRTRVLAFSLPRPQPPPRSLVVLLLAGPPSPNVFLQPARRKEQKTQCHLILRRMQTVSSCPSFRAPRCPHPSLASLRHASSLKLRCVSARTYPPLHMASPRSVIKMLARLSLRQLRQERMCRHMS